MSESAGFPYEYGSDLHWLWGWGKRLEVWLEPDNPANPACKTAWMIFRADRLAADAMMHFSVKYPHIIDQVSEMLKFTEARYAERDGSGDAEGSFINAMYDLHVRIWEAAETIANAESGTHDPRETGDNQAPANVTPSQGDPGASSNVCLRGRSPKHKPKSPTIPIYPVHAAKLFDMSKRSFLDAIDSGAFAAEWVGERKLRLDIDEVDQVDPEAAKRLDPALKNP